MLVMGGFSVRTDARGDLYILSKESLYKIHKIYHFTMVFLFMYEYKIQKETFTKMVFLKQPEVLAITVWREQNHPITSTKILTHLVFQSDKSVTHNTYSFNKVGTIYERD